MNPDMSLFEWIWIRILPSSWKKRKTLISTVLWLLYDFLSLKHDVMYLEKVSKQTLLASWRSLTKRAGSGSRSGFVSQVYGSAHLGHQTVIDLQYWLAALWGQNLLDNGPIGNRTKARQKGAQPIGKKSWAIENDAMRFEFWVLQELSRKLQHVLFLSKWTFKTFSGGAC